MFHLSIGVGRIYIYDNEDTPTYHLFFPHKSRNPRVVVIHTGELTPQVSAYAHFMAMYSKRHVYASPLDMDEFLDIKTLTSPAGKISIGAGCQ